MNKNLKNSLIHKFPIISILILILIYVYLNLPDFNPTQIGGKPTYKLPPFTPWLYKYRFAFVALPILLLILLIWQIYYSESVVINYDMWDMGSDFFSNFQKQFKSLKEGGYEPTYDTYTSSKLPTDKQKKEMTEDQLELINFLQISQDPRGALYSKTQFFCNAARPCNCCLDNKYTKEFFNCEGKTCENNSDYLAICKPKNQTPSS